jgi:hypothetical protein
MAAWTSARRSHKALCSPKRSISLIGSSRCKARLGIGADLATTDFPERGRQPLLSLAKNTYADLTSAPDQLVFVSLRRRLINEHTP